MNRELKQKLTLYKFTNITVQNIGGKIRISKPDVVSFRCPECGAEYIGLPEITNLNKNDDSQVYCPYCRQYIILDDYIQKRK